MAAEPKVINVDEFPELARLADEIEDSDDEIILRRGEKDIGRIVPMHPSYRELHPIEWELTEAQEEALKRAAGSWKGLIDAEKFKAENYASRDRSIGRPVN